MSKRLFDVAVSLIVILILCPLLMAIAVMVRCDSDGPIVFRQPRVGLRGRNFLMLKFRSMKQTSQSEAGAPLVTAAGDVRVTTVGARLRSSKLDELPQFVNVIRGDMSLVGPRPEVARYAAYWTEVQREVILSVRPGITDPTAVKFRREEDVLRNYDDPELGYVTDVLPQKAAAYVRYVENQSFFGDLRILIATVRRLFA